MTLSVKAWNVDGTEMKVAFVAGDRFELKLENERQASFYTLIAIWEISARRARGIYQLRTARAELETCNLGGSMHYELKIKGSNLADIKELYLMIQSGKVVPTLSFDEPQVSKTDGCQPLSGHQDLKPRLLLVGRRSHHRRR